MNASNTRSTAAPAPAAEARVTAAMLEAASASYARHAGRIGTGSIVADALKAGLAVALAELAAVQAEAAALRRALRATEAACGELAETAVGVGDNSGAGALQFVSGYIADRLAGIGDG